MKIVAAIALVVAIAGASRAADMPEFPFVFVYGTAVREVAPDMARLEVQLETYDANPTNALELLNKRSFEVATMLASNKTEKADVTAFDIRKTIVRKREGNEESAILGYRFQRTFKVVLRDLTLYKGIVGILRAMPNTENIESTFDNSQRNKISKELIREAAEDARRRANEIVQPFGARVGTVHAISERGFSDIGLEFGMGELHELKDRIQRMPRYSAADPFGDQKEDILFLPSTMRFEESITALFRLLVTDDRNSNQP